ncbi:MAG: FeS-binding protein [Deltaproteobacteria bacterium]|nr:FeS-binding protein [Deltaproteobacteria bacterium]
MAKNVRRKVYLTFPAAQVKEAIICDMYDKYKVRFNIRSASVNEQVGLMAVELEGPEDKVNESLKFFRSRGLTVEPIEMSVIEG